MRVRKRVRNPQRAIHIDSEARLRYSAVMGESAQKVIGYIRVSTDEQATEGISLEVQRDRIIHYCQQFGLNLLDIYQDEWTGKEIARQGLQAALSQMVQTDAMLMSLPHLAQRRRLELPARYVLWAECEVQVPRVRCCGSGWKDGGR